MADALVLGASLSGCGFKSHLPHQQHEIRTHRVRIDFYLPHHYRQGKEPNHAPDSLDLQRIQGSIWIESRRQVDKYCHHL